MVSLVDHIDLPENIIFSSLNFIIGSTTICGNVLSMIVMYKTRHTSFATKLASTWILFHLALSGISVGVWSLLCGVHLMTEELRNCLTIDHIRRFIGVAAPGALILFLGCISYDRYILLKHHTNHNKYMSRKKTKLLIALCWLMPFPVPFLRYVNQETFYMFVIVAILLVFVVVIVTYSCILRLVYQSEKNMRKKKPTNVALVDFQSADSANTLEFDSKTKEYVRLKRTIKLARTVTKLITTYLVCHAPLLLYLLIRITAPKLLVDKKKQIVLLVTECFSQINAGLIPFVYFMTSRTSQKGVKRLFCRNVK